MFRVMRSLTSSWRRNGPSFVKNDSLLPTKSSSMAFHCLIFFLPTGHWLRSFYDERCTFLDIMKQNHVDLKMIWFDSAQFKVSSRWWCVCCWKVNKLDRKEIDCIKISWYWRDLPSMDCLPDGLPSKPGYKKELCERRLNQRQISAREWHWDTQVFFSVCACS